MDYLNEYYGQYDEDGRLTRNRRGELEYLTTMGYIQAYLKPGDRVLEVGAGTGRPRLSHAGYAGNPQRRGISAVSGLSSYGVREPGFGGGHRSQPGRSSEAGGINNKMAQDETVPVPFLRPF